MMGKESGLFEKFFTEEERFALLRALTEGGGSEVSEDDWRVVKEWAVETAFEDMFLHKALTGYINLKVVDGEICLWRDDVPDHWREGLYGRRDMGSAVGAFLAALAETLPDHRVDVLTDLLSGLENLVNPGEVDALLTSLVDEVNGRLERGRW